MTAEKPSSGRELPGFFVRWRAGFGDAGNDLRPVDYLNDEDGLRRTIAARWLFRPNFVEHRGCVIVVTDGTDAEQLHEREIEIVDQ